MQTFQPNVFTSAVIKGTINFYHFHDLDVGWELQCQQKAKPAGFIFSLMFEPIGMQFDVIMKQFKLSILMLGLKEIDVIKGNDLLSYWLYR